MRRKFVACLFALTLALSGTVAMAAPTLIGLGDFSAGDNLVTFNSIANEALITSQYAGQGVTFSGALYGLTNSGDLALFPSNGGGVIASNWLYSQGNYAGLSFAAAFTTDITRVGFYLENWPSQTATIELFEGITSLGSITYHTASLTAEFVGIQDLAGFNGMVLSDTTQGDGFYAIDDFRFGSGAQAVPEPTTMLLLGLGMIGVAGVRRKL